MFKIYLNISEFFKINNSRELQEIYPLFFDCCLLFFDLLGLVKLNTDINFMIINIKNKLKYNDNHNFIHYELIRVLQLIEKLSFYGKKKKPTFFKKIFQRSYEAENAELYTSFQRGRFFGLIKDDEKILFEKMKANALIPLEEILGKFRLNEIYEQNPGLQKQLERIYEKDPDFNPDLIEDFFRANPDLNQMRLVR